MEKIEASVLRWLLAPEDEGKYEAEFDFDALLRADTKTRLSATLDQINRLMIRKYLDIAAHKVGANRHIQYLKAAWNWGSQRFKQVPEQNPCEKVTLNEEVSRVRYVEDWEYALVQDIILQTTRSPYLSVMMEFAYLCRLRSSEARELKHSDIKDGYVRIIRGKGSKGELTRISKRLQAAIDSAKEIFPRAPTPINGAHLYTTQTD